MTPDPRNPPIAADSENPVSFLNRNAVFLLLFIAAIVVGLFVPTIELFKGSVSLGRAPLWLAYVGLFVPECWPLPFGLVAIHLAGATFVAWIGDRLAKTIRTERESQT